MLLVPLIWIGIIIFCFFQGYFFIGGMLLLSAFTFDFFRIAILIITLLFLFQQGHWIAAMIFSFLLISYIAFITYAINKD